MGIHGHLFFSKYNSGTYNNQWIVLDYKLYTPGKDLQPGTLWIAEQLPGYILRADKTDTLKATTYWSSYNIPYFEFIYNISGYPENYAKHGDSYSYENCSRSRIFRRDQSKVTDMDSMKHIMRYNEWQTDPLSLHDACKSISARCDLNPPWATATLNNYSAFGATDAKITDNIMITSLQTLAVNGPTWDSQPPFAWTREWSAVPHFGHPHVFAFNWETIQPLLNNTNK